MDSNQTKQDADVISAIFGVMSSKELSGFDSIAEEDESDTHGFLPSTAATSEIEITGQMTEKTPPPPPNKDADRIPALSISMPASPTGRHSRTITKRVFFNDHPRDLPFSELPNASESVNATAYYSQPMPKGLPYEASASGMYLPPLYPTASQAHKLRDNRYDSFKTWSGRLERQLTRKKPLEPQPSERRTNEGEGALPVDRYFDALEGPELDTLRPEEELMLPQDKTWPFLLRYPISSFGICLGVSSQAILWKTLATSPSTNFLHISPLINLVLWCISIALVTLVAFIYLLKVIFFFEAVRREYYHPIRVNFFFAPFIAVLFLLLGLPPSVATKPHHVIWYIAMFPFLCLELKIYGQWMSGGQRRLSKVANPSNHLSVVGNFVGALLGASMGLKEGPIFFFAVGMAHYTVLFVTLYQRLPTNETLPKDLHPVFFLFVAAPSVASMAWAKIEGSFNYGARIAYFIALFLYISLAVRINFFRGIKFSLAWWAYTFPMTGAAIATIRYSNEVTNRVTQALAVILSTASTLTVSALLITTLVQAFVFQNLFPNDIAIAISGIPPKPNSWFNMRNDSSGSKDIEHFMQFVRSGGNDVENPSIDANSYCRSEV
ncbi:hypothetical protein RND81_12G108500 [Saponaria officinalis]|uniref:S-type anion channel SLAH2 n=1 Tax=Saponaria officinalis TaxID=3572 RepID=A0AAW1H922_SAPOF